MTRTSDAEQPIPPRQNGTAALDGTLEIRCPADGHLAASLPTTAPADVRTMAAELRAAQPAWEALGPDGRAAVLRRWLEWLMDHEQRILGLVQEESGKSWGDTTMETAIAVDVINYVTRHGAAFLADHRLRPHTLANATKRLAVRHRPHQLVGVITPWNYPLGMPMLDVPPALMAGAAVLSKPSEATPVAWSEAVRGWREEIGAPPVLACAIGRGDVGATVVDEVDMIQFTGSTRTGRAVAIRAAERLIPTSLELGGKDAMIVLEDADLARAVGGATWGGLFSSGQSCIAVERIYVHQEAYEPFVDQLATAVRGLRQGMDAAGAFATDVGAMVTPAQIELVERQVQDARDKGARVLTGGRRAARGRFFEPTVLVDVDHGMACMTEETFGPLLPVMRVRDEEEAVHLANDSRYGLGGSVWTADLARAERISRRLRTGSVTVNNTMIHALQLPLPMGGWGESGIGHRSGGAHAILKYCRPQAYVTERMHPAREVHWYPYTRTRGRLMGRMVRVLGMHDWRRRLR